MSKNLCLPPVILGGVAGVGGALGGRQMPVKTRPIPELEEKHRNRFWANIDKTTILGPNGDCWKWKGGKHQKGYGIFRIGANKYRAHRVSYHLENGSIPDGLMVLHKCDITNCCRPSHLWLGTHQDNVDDMFRKGRANRATGNRHGSITCPESRPKGKDHFSYKHPEKISRGETISSKLTEADIKQIRIDYSPSENSIYKLAKKYNVTPQTIYLIIKRKTWSHVQNE